MRRASRGPAPPRPPGKPRPLPRPACRSTSGFPATLLRRDVTTPQTPEVELEIGRGAEVRAGERCRSGSSCED
ncbi:hypothetical protein Y1Q_0004096 [Alligator mississippiensis]|uniref:Uncharacterized protein n=1 Tax=Alligator mississippiensis TaxID=8496 RepID=A0A151PHW3_ALLMI|nr:hypothetical protein Y1Q_0004096 [Alligator mississippiensis]